MEMNLYQLLSCACVRMYVCVYICTIFILPLFSIVMKCVELCKTALA